MRRRYLTESEWERISSERGGLFWDKPHDHGLAAHAAVKNYGKGVSSDDLASFVECLASLGASRARGVGHDEYGQGTLQKFETTDQATTVQDILEELADTMVYVSFLAIRVLAGAR